VLGGELYVNTLHRWVEEDLSKKKKKKRRRKMRTKKLML
jgi:hypothetical protein